MRRPTLNGQNVEFIAGQKQPFVLGQSVVVGDSNNVQQFFYKHVGTYISVTPHIVNWGPNYKGRGRVPAGAYHYFDIDEVHDWIGLRDAIAQSSDLRQQNIALFELLEKNVQDRSVVNHEKILFVLNELVGKYQLESDTRGSVLHRRIDRRYLAERFSPFLKPHDMCSGCDWEPSDCTIDLAIVCRLSDTGSSTVEINRDAGPQSLQVPTESNVRAIANIVQVKSGHGLVMGGLISEQDSEIVNKTPVLGDVPVFGYLFRSKQCARIRTETLIFVV